MRLYRAPARLRREISSAWRTVVRRRDHPLPGTAEYREHVREEIEHYAGLYEDDAARQSLFYAVPPSWTEAEVRAAALIRDATSHDMTGNVISRLTARPGVRMLSLGSGPGSLELGFAGGAPDAEIVCLDINPTLMDLGRRHARERGLNVTFEEADLNLVTLPPNGFDVVFCHASLHHMIELEHIARQIKRTLRPGGELITVDVVTANGYRMWPETREVVRALWKTLPRRFRLNHTAYAQPRVDEEIWEADTSASGMECVRSEDILPILERTFEVAYFVPYFSISRRFFDTMYGPNFDLTAPLDLALFNWIWELDRHYLAAGRLRPETFFGIYRPR